MKQVVQGSSDSPIPVNIQDQVGWGPEEPGLVEDVSAYCRGVGLNDF